MLKYLIILSIFIKCIDDSRSKNTNPNIVIILADDLGWNDVGFHGSNLIPTPNIDSLAYSGMILQRHYVLPMCTPSRAALMTGRYPFRYGLQGYPLRSGEQSGLSLKEKLLPQHMKNLGYSTHLVGKWHLGFSTEDYSPCSRGFDTWLGYYSGYLGYRDLAAAQGVAELNTTFYGLDIHDCQNKSRKDLVGKYLTDIITDRAVDIIKQQQDGDQPFFMMVAHDAVHTGNTSEAVVGLEPPPDMNVNETFGYIDSYERRLFAGMLTSLDQSVGKIVSTLGDQNLLNNTLILFLSDNGGATVSLSLEPNFSSNWPLRGVKFSLFEGGVRGNGVLWSSVFGSGKISNTWLHITDWLPTLYSLAGGDIKDLGLVDGRNQIEKLKTDKDIEQKPIYLNIDTTNEGIIIKNRYKIIKSRIRDQGFYEKHSGCENTTDAPPYSIEKLRNSQCGSAILKVNNSLDENKIHVIRSSATIDCDVTCLYTFGYVESSNDFLCPNYCLFDLENDRCEEKDISADEGGILEEGIRYLDEMRENVIGPVNNGVVDPRSNPDLHDGNWVPWLV